MTKWLGDGAMLSSFDTQAVVAMVLELGSTNPAAVPLEIRAGLGRGPGIMFEGDDYIGGPVNLAARLSDVAGPREILACAELAEFVPDDSSVHFASGSPCSAAM